MISACSTYFLVINFVTNSKSSFFLGLPQCHNAVCSWFTVVDPDVQELQRKAGFIQLKKVSMVRTKDIPL